MRDSELLIGRINGLRYEREERSQPDVEIPPAQLITDELGGMWTLGTEYEVRDGNFEFNVLRNDVDTGEMAAKIVYRQGRVWLYGRDGRRWWTGRGFI